MSGLWEYDNDDDLQDDDIFEPPEPAVDVIEDSPPDRKATHKRKPGRKAANPGGGRAKRRAASPVYTDLSLKPPPQPAPILLVNCSDDEDDIALLPSADKPRRSSAGAASATPPAARMRGELSKPTAPVLDPATLKALAKEQELLNALRQVTAMQEDEEDEDFAELEPLPSISRLPPLGFPRLSGRLPSQALDGSAAGVGSSAGLYADTAIAGASAMAGAGPGGKGGDVDTEEPTAVGAGRSADAAAAKPAPTDRVLLKLLWHSGKDGHLMMRVGKKDPVSKMIEKFREIARTRDLCKDPNKIKRRGGSADTGDGDGGLEGCGQPRSA